MPNFAIFDSFAAIAITNSQHRLGKAGAVQVLVEALKYYNRGGDSITFLIIIASHGQFYKKNVMRFLEANGFDVIRQAKKLHYDCYN